jgi:hypothetical protein
MEQHGYPSEATQLHAAGPAQARKRVIQNGTTDEIC